MAACGKKGLRFRRSSACPAAPDDLAAERRAGAVELQFTVPAANTDGTRPANISRVDVYAFTGPSAVTPEQAGEARDAHRQRPVKAPRDPDAVVGPDETDADLEPLEGSRLDQGAPAHVPRGAVGAPPTASADCRPPLRRRGHHHARPPRPILEARRPCPLRPPPQAPASPKPRYDEKRCNVTWPARPWTPRLPTRRSVAYNVYEVTRAPSAGEATRRLTTAPTDGRVCRSAHRVGRRALLCVRAVRQLDGLAAESEASPADVRHVDGHVRAGGAGRAHARSALTAPINLTWDPNAENGSGRLYRPSGAAPTARSCRSRRRRFRRRPSRTPCSRRAPVSTPSRPSTRRATQRGRPARVDATAR